jgi:hypothetical protein
MAPKRNKPVPEQVTFSNTDVRVETSVKVLGITVDSKLNFNSHIKDICIKSARQINALRRIAGHLDTATRMTIYRSFILSNFNYCPIIWHYCSLTSAKKLEKLQERCLRLVFNDYCSDYSLLLDKANLPSLTLGRLRALATETYKILNKQCPEYLADLFHFKIIKYNLRNSNLLDIPNFKTSRFGRHSFKIDSVFIWNNLPNDCRSATTLHEFKKLIQTWNGCTCKCAMCRIHINR